MNDDYSHIQTIFTPDEYNNFYFTDTIKNTLEIDRTMCKNDTEYLVLSSMLDDGSYRHDSCFPYDKIIGSEGWEFKKSLTENKDIASLKEILQTLESTSKITENMYRQKFDYSGIDIYPSGAIEILFVDKDLNKITSFMNRLESELKNYPGIVTSRDENRGPEGKINGEKLVILHSIKEKNRPLQKHVLSTLDKFNIDYSNTGLYSLKKIIDSERVTDRAERESLDNEFQQSYIEELQNSGDLPVGRYSDGSPRYKGDRSEEQIDLENERINELQFKSIGKEIKATNEFKIKLSNNDFEGCLEYVNNHDLFKEADRQHCILDFYNHFVNKDLNITFDPAKLSIIQDLAIQLNRGQEIKSSGQFNPIDGAKAVMDYDLKSFNQYLVNNKTREREGFNINDDLIRLKEDDFLAIALSKIQLEQSKKGFFNNLFSLTKENTLSKIIDISNSGISFKDYKEQEESYKNYRNNGKFKWPAYDPSNPEWMGAAEELKFQARQLGYEIMPGDLQDLQQLSKELDSIEAGHKLGDYYIEMREDMKFEDNYDKFYLLSPKEGLIGTEFTKDQIESIDKSKVPSVSSIRNDEHKNESNQSKYER